MIVRKVLGSIKSWARLVGTYGFATGSKIYAATRIRWKGPVSVRVSGERLVVRPDSPDLSVARSTLTEEFAPLENLLPRGFNGLIIDAGGYIGTAAIKLARMYPEATVVTIEPSQENFRILSQNIRRFPNIVALQAALVSANRASVRLSNRGTGPWGYTIIEEPEDRPDAGFLETVSTVTLKEITEKHGGSAIGIAKIDIEGAEKELFLSDDEELRKATVIFVELHDRIVAGCTASFEGFSRDRTVTQHGGEKYLSVLRSGGATPAL